MSWSSLLYASSPSLAWSAFIAPSVGASRVIGLEYRVALRLNCEIRYRPLVEPEMAAANTGLLCWSKDQMVGPEGGNGGAGGCGGCGGCAGTPMPGSVICAGNGQAATARQTRGPRCAVGTGVYGPGRRRRRRRRRRR